MGTGESDFTDRGLRWVPQATWSTTPATATITPIRDPASEPVKWERTRERRSFDFPNYNSLRLPSKNMQTPRLNGRWAPRCRLRRRVVEVLAE